MDRVTKELGYLSVQIKTIDDDINELQKTIDAVSYWGKGFRHVRLVAILRAIDVLEIEVNSALEQLGLIGWKVKFDVERETKSKTITKGFHVSFYPPNTSKPIPWESWSGGESQRLRIAGRIAISNMILQYRGVRPSLEVWDEPTQYLSQEGITDLVNALKQRAYDLGVQIWLTDHRSYDLGGFSGYAFVEKTKQGSEIKTYLSGVYDE